MGICDEQAELAIDPVRSDLNRAPAAWIDSRLLGSRRCYTAKGSAVVRRRPLLLVVSRRRSLSSSSGHLQPDSTTSPRHSIGQARTSRPVARELGWWTRRAGEASNGRVLALVTATQMQDGGGMDECDSGGGRQPRRRWPSQSSVLAGLPSLSCGLLPLFSLSCFSAILTTLLVPSACTSGFAEGGNCPPWRREGRGNS
uniref:Uncharacterized protein n=1 Tax=Leersia perrieri TaxID=77586 RepID=A0A0D9UYM7_9ORYZ